MGPSRAHLVVTVAVSAVIGLALGACRTQLLDDLGGVTDDGGAVATAGDGAVTGGVRDASAPVLDFALPDLAPAASVACGNLVCSGSSPVCCRMMRGPGMCVASRADCNGQPSTCDDPSDCAAGEVCCLTRRGASCEAAGACRGLIGCLQDADCSNGQMCCSLGGPVSPSVCAPMCGF